MKCLLILLLAIPARDALSFECHRRLLTAEEQRSLEAYVLETRAIAVDPNTIVACRNWDTVTVNTVRAPQSDGSERFARLNCWLTRKTSPTAWQCVGDPFTGFRIDTFPGELGAWVAISTPTELDLARRLAERGIALLGYEGNLPYCGGGKRGAARSLADLRKEITGGDGLILLARQRDRFWFTVGEGVTIVFEYNSTDGARVDCWHLEEITVTG